MAGETDAFTVLRMIKAFGGGDLMTGMLYLGLILAASILVFAFGCAFHSGDRHAFVREDPKRVKKHHGKIVLTWLCAVITMLPMLIAIAMLIVRYMPVLSDPSGFVAGTVDLPPTQGSLIIAGVGAVLTVPFMPLRSLITAAFIEGLK